MIHGQEGCPPSSTFLRTWQAGLPGVVAVVQRNHDIRDHVVQARRGRIIARPRQSTALCYYSTSPGAWAMQRRLQGLQGESVCAPAVDNWQAARRTHAARKVVSQYSVLRRQTYAHHLHRLHPHHGPSLLSASTCIHEMNMRVRTDNGGHPFQQVALAAVAGDARQGLVANPPRRPVRLVVQFVSSDPDC